MSTECKKIYIRNLGCGLRALDCARIELFFKLNGHKIVYKPEEADHIILSTCILVREMRHVSCASVKKLTKLQGQLIVTGCLPSLVKKEQIGLNKVNFIGHKDLNGLDDVFKDFKVKFASVPDSNFMSKEFEWKSTPNRETSKTFLRIGKGCNEFCTFCPIRVSAGKFVSKPLEVCLSEYKNLLEKGHRSFKVTAEDVGAYGTGIGSSLPELLDEMFLMDSQYEGIQWEIDNLNPFWTIKLRHELVRFLRTGRISAINSQVQSASDRILHLMNRHYKIKDFEEALLDFFKTWPSLSFLTTIMVGFPSETHDEFMASVVFAKKFNAYTTVQCYSNNEDSPSYKLPNQLDRELKLKRKSFAEYYLRNMPRDRVVSKEQNLPIASFRY